MYLKELAIRNHGGFYGEHVFRFRRGANLVAGGPRAGKTWLCSAVEFALRGGASRGREELANTLNRRRAAEKGLDGWAGCEVELLLMGDGGEQRVEREFSWLDGCHARERLLYSVEPSPRISPQHYRDHVYVGEAWSLREGSDADTVLEALLGLAERNVKEGPGFMLLDETLSGFPTGVKVDAVEALLGSGLDQVVVLADPTEALPGAPAYRLGESVDSAVFKVEGFPFEPTHLFDKVECVFRNTYVTRGDSFTGEVYGRRYTVEAVEVTPDGARVNPETTRLSVT